MVDSCSIFKISAFFLLFSVFAQASDPVPAIWVRDLISFGYSEVGKIEHWEKLDQETQKKLVQAITKKLYQKINGLDLNQNQKEMFGKIASEWTAVIPKPFFIGVDGRSQMLPMAKAKLGYHFDVSGGPTKEFIDIARYPDQRPLLDIGCSWGFHTKKALEKGAYVIATDIDPTHIVALVKMLDEKSLSHLSVHVGQFPEDLDLSENSVRGINFTNVAHYLDPDQLRTAILKIHKFLVPGGLLTFMAGTIYLECYDKIRHLLKFAEDAAKAEWADAAPNTPHRIPFPLFIPDLTSRNKLIEKNWIKPSKIRLLPHPQSIGLIDRALQSAGFQIEVMHYYGQESERRAWITVPDYLPVFGPFLGIVATKSEF